MAPRVRKRSVSPSRRRSAKIGTRTEKSALDLERRWPHIAELIDGNGEISIGRIAAFDCAAVATDESTLLATIVRRNGESLQALLERLNEAISRAIDEDDVTDEING